MIMFNEDILEYEGGRREGGVGVGEEINQLSHYCF
jgi:hypothetical protein